MHLAIHVDHLCDSFFRNGSDPQQSNLHYAGTDPDFDSHDTGFPDSRLLSCHISLLLCSAHDSEQEKERHDC